jgi:hypothetical protein
MVPLFQELESLAFPNQYPVPKSPDISLSFPIYSKSI